MNQGWKAAHRLVKKKASFCCFMCPHICMFVHTGNIIQMFTTKTRWCTVSYTYTKRAKENALSKEKEKLKEVLKRNGSERRRADRKCAQERNRREAEKWGRERQPVGEEAPSEFQAVLAALLSHLDLYCTCLGIPQGLADTAQGRNPPLSWEIKSKRQIQWKISLRAPF